MVYYFHGSYDSLRLFVHGCRARSGDSFTGTIAHEARRLALGVESIEKFDSGESSARSYMFSPPQATGRWSHHLTGIRSLGRQNGPPGSVRVSAYFISLHTSWLHSFFFFIPCLSFLPSHILLLHTPHSTSPQCLLKHPLKLTCPRLSGSSSHPRRWSTPRAT